MMVIQLSAPGYWGAGPEPAGRMQILGLSWA